MTTRAWRAIAVGLGAGVVQHAMQPIPVWLSGYRAEPWALIEMPTWASVLWAASALALGVVVTVAALVVKHWTIRSRFRVVIAGIAAYCLVNIAIAAPHLYGDWFNGYVMLALGFSLAVVIAGVVTWAATAVLVRWVSVRPQVPSRRAT